MAAILCLQESMNVAFVADDHSCQILWQIAANYKHENETHVLPTEKKMTVDVAGWTICHAHNWSHQWSASKVLFWAIPHYQRTTKNMSSKRKEQKTCYDSPPHLVDR